MNSSYFLPLVVSLVISLIVTPLMRKLAFKVEAVDIPKDNRRMHKKPIPFLGGVAIYIAVVVGILLYMPLDNSTTISILIGGSIIMISGLIDDFKDLSPKKKLLFQILAGIILIMGGIEIKTLTYPLPTKDASTLIQLGILSIPVTLFWIVGITNTINLIDGIDGLSAGVATISSITLMVVARKLGDPETIILSGILAGACLGFLPYNFNPAKIFMGDAGALFLGFMLAGISIEGVMKSAATIAVVVPILILGIPIFDTTFAIIRRLAKGQNPMQADKGHLHHRLLRRGFSVRNTVLILYGVSMFFGVAAVGIVKVNSKQSVQLSIVLFIITIVFAVLVGRFEKNQKDENPLNDELNDNNDNI